MTAVRENRGSWSINTFEVMAILGDTQSLGLLENNLKDTHLYIPVNRLLTKALRNKQRVFAAELLDRFPEQILENEISDEVTFLIAYAADESIITKLVQLGFLKIATPQQQNKLLFFAIEYGNAKVVEVLFANNLSYYSKDYFYNNILHQAVISFEKGPLLLKNILSDPRGKELVTEKNIFGKTPSDHVRLSNNENLIKIFEEYLITIPKLEINDPQLTNLSQAKVNESIKYFMKLDYADIKNYYSSGGYCNAYDFLFLYYANQRRFQYFYHSLSLLSHWDRNPSTLYEEQQWQQLEQATYYKNLYSFFRQWLNNLNIFFGVATMRAGITQGQAEREKQLQLVTDSNAELRQIYRVSMHLGASGIRGAIQTEILLTKEQLEETLKYICRMPPGVCVSLGGASHASSLFISDNNAYYYYDSNFDEQCAVNDNYQKLTSIIFNTKYLWLKKAKDQNDTIEITWNIFYLSNALMNKHQNEFHCFKSDELPSSIEQAKLFQKSSPNNFTPLHITVLTGSLLDFNRLINDGYCDINAKDACSRTALEMAISSANREMINVLISQKEIIIDDSIETSLIYLYDTLNEKDLFYEILQHANAKDLTFLVKYALRKRDDFLIEYLLSSGKLQANESILLCLSQLYPFGYSGDKDLEVNNALLIRFLNLSGADIFSKKDDHSTILFDLINRKIPFYIWLTPEDVNKKDAWGNMAIHYAVKKPDAFNEILKLGANIFSINSNGDTAIDLAIEGRADSKVMQFIVNNTDFDLNLPIQKNQLYKLLIYAIDKSLEETLVRQLITKCNNEILSSYVDNESMTFYLLRKLGMGYFDQILSKGIDINQPIFKDSSQTLFAYAKEFNIEVLLTALSSIEDKSQDIQKPLH